MIISEFFSSKFGDFDAFFFHKKSLDFFLLPSGEFFPKGKNLKELPGFMKEPSF
jgi:hypothetical protein